MSHSLGSPIIHEFKYNDESPGIVGLYRDSLRVNVGNEVYIYDLEGRPVFLYLDGKLYVRGLSGIWVEKKWVSIRPPRRYSRVLRDKEEYAAILARSLKVLKRILELDIDSRIGGFISYILDRGVTRLEVEERKFREVYKPISILPPDQYLSIVLQPVEGCPYNMCSFCTFYRDRRFRFKSVDEFEKHVEEIKLLVGKGYYMRRKIFFADANALIAPTDLLLKYMGITWKYFDHGIIDGIYSFIDYFHKPKTVEELIQLRRQGLRRVYVGLESGSTEVLNILNKPGPPSESVKLVESLKAADINVGVIILIGAGGREYYNEHVANTVDILNRMPLGKGDILYYSRLKIRPDSAYARLSEEYGITALSQEEMDRQINEINKKLVFHWDKPVIAEYDIDEFVY